LLHPLGTVTADAASTRIPPASPAIRPAGIADTAGTGTLSPDSTPSSGTTDQSRRSRVLIIDDEVVFSAALRRLFSGEHEVTVANRGQDALGRVLAGERFDAILCDLLMPEVTGIDVYKELRRIAPDQADCIIFLTGGAFSYRAQHFLDGIANPWFEKPCNLETLRAAVRAVALRNGSSSCAANDSSR
jgi:CheY-like chemotaxis protein